MEQTHVRVLNLKCQLIRRIVVITCSIQLAASYGGPIVVKKTLTTGERYVAVCCALCHVQNVRHTERPIAAVCSTRPSRTRAPQIAVAVRPDI